MKDDVLQELRTVFGDNDMGWKDVVDKVSKLISSVQNSAALLKATEDIIRKLQSEIRDRDKTKVCSKDCSSELDDIKNRISFLERHSVPFVINGIKNWRKKNV